MGAFQIGFCVCLRVCSVLQIIVVFVVSCCCLWLLLLLLYVVVVEVVKLLLLCCCFVWEARMEVGLGKMEWAGLGERVRGREWAGYGRSQVGPPGLERNKGEEWAASRNGLPVLGLVYCLLFL